MDNTNKAIEFRERVLNSQSPSMCAAKWTQATVWLYSGLTASCHHPPSHPIPLSEINKDPSALHNTEFKKNVRKEMQQGKRPKECEYCWKIEDMGSEFVSDRVFHSFSSTEEEVKAFKNKSYTLNYNPSKLEVAFDRTCQFACSYCNPSYSTTWVKDIQNNGPYKGLDTDTRMHYTSTHTQSDPYFGKDSNPYIEAFWKWWPSLKLDLKQLRITGGEPLMSPHLWRLLDLVSQDQDFNLKLAINSNLGAKKDLIEKFIATSHSLKHVEIFTSNEAFGPHADYIRDGMNYAYWRQNVIDIMTKGNVQRVHVMMTINGLCLASIVPFLNDMIELKKELGHGNPTLSMNIIRWPTFQSPLVVPKDIRDTKASELEQWLEQNKGSGLLSTYEQGHCERLIQYLRSAESATEGAAPVEKLEQDLKRFLQQYDARRNKNFSKDFPEWSEQWMSKVSI